MLSGIVSVTAWWRDYERLTDESAAKETNWWNYPVRPMPTPSENDLSPSASKPVNYKGGFPLYRAGYGYFRGRRAAQDLEGEEFKWRAYRPVKTSSKGHKKPAEQKSEHKKSGFVPYRAGYGYFSGRR